ncbi:Uncharacterized protein HZ326_23019 [Fusarium oxysporum f. sp. albedinis]|jgi:hypothetical protein|nr:hypothetical protein HZ326_29194 [Fusarium oxysporum f. sp. albedinis]KAJ0133928.1 Uncharacterized protein HZ326_23019 [Fusarium oxysporum f. sp. albedinis]
MGTLVRPVYEMRIHWFGVAVNSRKVGGKGKLHSLHDGSLYYWKSGVSCFLCYFLAELVICFLEGAIIILDDAELETGLRT